jgi:hypothetical protein
MRTLVIFFWTNQTPTQGNSKKGGKGFYETDTQIDVVERRAKE